MQSFLVALTAEQQAAQWQQADTAATEAAADTARRLADKKRPGRPCSTPAASSVASLDEEPAEKKRKYTQWFSTPLIHDILKAYRENSRSPRATVASLKRRFPRLPSQSEGRYDDLSESTMRNWFDDNGDLKEKYQAMLEQGYSTGPGRTRVLAAHPDVEQRIKEILLQMREHTQTGVSVSTQSIKWVMLSVFSQMRPALLLELKLTKVFLATWAREQMHWSWRVATTEASKVPEDWKERGIAMAKKIAVVMQTNEVHPSLVVNFDQAGLRLTPTTTRTYHQVGAKSVPLVCSDDKRQITAVVGSSFDGSLLPLQLIFKGKTEASHPRQTVDSAKAGFHLAHSHNHWSTQETMQEYIEHVIAPYRRNKAAEHGLGEDAQVLLVLDVWSVHISMEFRAFLAEKHPYIHLVYIPPNCTSKLQVADVALNFPFKHGVKRRFNAWASMLVQQQIEAGSITGIKPLLGMANVKLQILEWALDSWNSLSKEKVLIQRGWHKCVVEHFDIESEEERKKAVREQVRHAVTPIDAIPEDKEEEPAEYDSESDDEDAEKTERQIMKEKVYGERKSIRERKQAEAKGYMLNSSQLKFS